MTVSTGLDSEGKRASVVVEDTGEGIEAGSNWTKHLHGLRLQQGRPSGTGLGLPVTQKILQEARRWRLASTSQVGRGSTVHVLELPLSPPEKKEDADSGEKRAVKTLVTSSDRNFAATEPRASASRPTLYCLPRRLASTQPDSFAAQPPAQPTTIGLVRFASPSRW